jgi:hypothetical protein
MLPDYISYTTVISMSFAFCGLAVPIVTDQIEIVEFQLVTEQFQGDSVGDRSHRVAQLLEFLEHGRRYQIGTNGELLASCKSPIRKEAQKNKTFGSVIDVKFPFYKKINSTYP